MLNSFINWNLYGRPSLSIFFSLPCSLSSVRSVGNMNNSAATVSSHVALFFPYPRFFHPLSVN